MSIKSELLQIQNANKNQVLFPLNVVKWAKSHPKSALHSRLEWDDEKAGHEHRLWQVRQLIKIYVVLEDGSPQIVSLSFDRKGDGGYRSVSDVLTNRQLSEIMLQDALADLQRVEARYQHVRELTSVWTEVKRVRAKKTAAKQPSAEATL